MSYETLLYEQSGGVAHVTLNRPDRLNALNQLTFEELDDAIDHIEQDDAIRVWVLSAAAVSTMRNDAL